MLDGMPDDETARLATFLRGARALLEGYFAVEDPRRLEPAEREALVSTLVGDELLIRGYIDRLDVSPAGDLRVVDYKTGGAPREAFEGRALFQLKFYALVLWRTRGVVPRVLRLLYLRDAEICDYSPDADELERFERTLLALSQAIERAKRDRDFRPKPSRLCDWCNHQALCPAFGGTPPPYPEPTGEPGPVPPSPDDTTTVRITTATVSATPSPVGTATVPATPSPLGTATVPATPSPAGTATVRATPSPGGLAADVLDRQAAPVPPQHTGSAASDQPAPRPTADAGPASGHRAGMPIP